MNWYTIDKQTLRQEFISCRLFILHSRVYYTNDSDRQRLYRIRTDGSDRTQLNNDASWGIEIIDDWVYYGRGLMGMSYKIRTDGSDRTKLIDGYKSNRSDIYTHGITVDGWVYKTDYSDGEIYRTRSNGTERQHIAYAAT